MITNNLNVAIDALTNNKVIAIPTETVYGLAGNAFDEKAIHQIFALKKRPHFNPLIIHIDSIKYLEKVAVNIPAIAYQLAAHFWPGPLTLILKKHPSIPDLVTSGKDTVGIRVPNHPVALALLHAIQFPLAAPSANPFGSISPTTAEHVESYFKDDLEVILNGGPCEKGIESTIIGFEDNEPILYRHGSIAIEEIEKITGKIKVNNKNDINPVSPGMLSRHYAPSTPTYLTSNPSEFKKFFEGEKIGLLLFQKKHADKSIIHQEILSEKGDLHVAAQNLYAALHRLDNADLDIIIAEKFPDVGIGKTINDRLQRAVKKN